MYSTNEKELKKEIKRLPPLYEKIKYDYYFYYTPVTICRFTKAGKINYYKTPTDDSTKSSFFVSTLTENALFHFNKVLKQIKVNEVHKLYEYEYYSSKSAYERETELSIPRYYISFKKDNKIVSTHIYSLEEAPKELKRLIEFLQYLKNKIIFKVSSDTLIIENLSKQIFDSEIELSSQNYKTIKRIRFVPPK
jgi:hypothetical protein